VFGMVAGIALYAFGRRRGSAIELPAGSETVIATGGNNRRSA
jgi:hypothetical protein